VVPPRETHRTTAGVHSPPQKTRGRARTCAALDKSPKWVARSQFKSGCRVEPRTSIPRCLASNTNPRARHPGSQSKIRQGCSLVRARSRLWTVVLWSVHSSLLPPLELTMSCARFEPYPEERLMATTAKPRDKLLATLDGLLDQAVRVVPRPRTNFSAAIRAMHDGRYDATRDRFRRLEVHELLARDITAAIEAGEATDRAPEFLKRVLVRLSTD
jgi:hypothetical protein